MDGWQDRHPGQELAAIGSGLAGTLGTVTARSDEFSLAGAFNWHGGSGRLGVGSLRGECRWRNKNASEWS